MDRFVFISDRDGMREAGLSYAPRVIARKAKEGVLPPLQQLTPGSRKGYFVSTLQAFLAERRRVA